MIVSAYAVIYFNAETLHTSIYLLHNQSGMMCIQTGNYHACVISKLIKKTLVSKLPASLINELKDIVITQSRAVLLILPIANCVVSTCRLLPFKSIKFK